MRISIPTLAIAAAVSILLQPPAAQAQKAEDTVRIALNEAIATLVINEDPRPEPELFTHAVFDSLICYDAASEEYKPLLAKSWTQPDPKTIVFQLRDDVKFHDGSPLTADDVVYTLRYYADPASKLRFATANMAWMDRVEKVDDHTVRVVAKQPSPIPMVILSSTADILPAKLHGGYATKTDFGRQHPIGTGPYKVVSLDATKGVELVKNPDYPQGNDCKHGGSIGHVVGIPITDQQTQIAQLTVGGIDFMRGRSKDQADMMSQMPNVAVTTTEGLTYSYMSMDSTNRAGVAALSDQRVRRALSMAFDRQAVARSVFAGGDEVVALDAMCRRVERGCDYSTKPPAFDRTAAKKLLADAGYADGFDVEITVPTGMDSLAEAIGGELRKIGVRAKIEKVTVPAYRQKQTGGKIQILVWLWGQPDVYSTAALFFDGGPRDYWHDAKLTDLMNQGIATTDLAARKAIYRQLFDRVNEMNYILPVSTVPELFIHSKDLFVKKGSISRTGVDITDMHWQ
jgi:peptide/nickel transport system substrate-binding protein